MTTALVPGSFDPPTHGHVDVIQRALEIYDRVIVAVVANPSKTPLFTADERVEMLNALFRDESRVEVASFAGLLVDFARERGADVFMKGLRAVTDFDYELQMAQMNRHLSGIDTVFVATSPQYAYLSSSLVKEVARFGASVDTLVPPLVAAKLKERYAE